MRKTVVVAAALTSLHLFFPALAQPAPDDAALSGGRFAGAPSQSVEACWEEWRVREGLEEGKNQRGDSFVLLSQTQESVMEDSKSRNWVSARNAAFNQAEIQARAKLAQTISSTLQSERSLIVSQFGGDDSPAALKQAADELSIADKARVLAGKALDDQIKRFDPKWDGSGLSDEQKRNMAVTLQARVQQNMARSARIFASGAFTAIQCEGASTQDKGRYAVLVGLVWSKKLSAVAEAIWNPSLKLKAENPQRPLREQFAAFQAENADWLAYTSGARVFTDENGERVIVGFGVAPQSSMMSVDGGRAGLQAQVAIQRFVGEVVEANDELKEIYERREFANESSRSFDNSSFSQRVTLRSKDLKLAGATEVATWRGEHPWSGARMHVTAVAWTPRWAADSKATGDAMKAAEQRMDRQGAVPSPQQGPRGAQSGVARGGAAAPAKAGARSTTSDF